MGEAAETVKVRAFVGSICEEPFRKGQAGAKALRNSRKGEWKRETESKVEQIRDSLCSFFTLRSFRRLLELGTCTHSRKRHSSTPPSEDKLVLVAIVRILNLSAGV